MRAVRPFIPSPLPALQAPKVGSAGSAITMGELRSHVVTAQLAALDLATLQAGLNDIRIPAPGMRIRLEGTVGSQRYLVHIEGQTTAFELNCAANKTVLSVDADHLNLVTIQRLGGPAVRNATDALKFVHNQLAAVVTVKNLIDATDKANLGKPAASKHKLNVAFDPSSRSFKLTLDAFASVKPGTTSQRRRTASAS